MTDEFKVAPKPISPHTLNKKEMRASLLLPVLISVGLLGLGMIVWQLAPDAFDTGMAIAISLCLLAFLLFSTRHSPAKQRVTAVLLAIPALVGIGYGMSNGRVSPIILGVSLTALLLVVYRALSIPLSYRFALRRLNAGDSQQALELLDKTITARPGFWEAHQLKAIIYLEQQEFPRAERAAKEAIAANPRSDAAANTLGQIYLAQAHFAAARAAFIDAVERNPDHALHWYHLGLCQYRLAEYADAAESLAAATQRSPRLLEYELWEHYYLWHCLKQCDRPTEMAQAHEKMVKFAAGLPRLQAQLAKQPPTPHLPFMQADLVDLAKQLPLNP